MSVLLAYSKIAVNRDLLHSDLPEDPLLVEDLVRDSYRMIAPKRLAAEVA